MKRLVTILTGMFALTYLGLPGRGQERQERKTTDYAKQAALGPEHKLLQKFVG
jgi:hypothetical protein